MVRYNHVTPDENHLFSLLKTKNISSFTYLYNTYSAALYGAILQIVPDEETADQVLVEVLGNIWKAFESYDPGKRRFLIWMLNIARKAANEKKTSFL